MNLFELFFKVGVDDQASAKISKLTQKLGNGLKASAKIGVAAVGTASTAIGILTKKSLESYAEYEQLVGGVQTLFKNSADAVIKYADEAFATAGLSANDYMSTVTSFSASLLQSLEGDTQAAAELANQALIDMSDNANKMGTDMSMIQNAYQGFAKANYTMLDNLKLGYGGTQTEMRRLIRDAAALDESIDASSMSFANIVKAINVVQTQMGITGTTAKEASTTIQGSVNAAKAAWENLKVAMVTGNGDIEQRVDQFVGSVEVAADNILPKLEVILKSMAKVIRSVAPEIIRMLPEITREILPELADATADMVVALIEMAPELLDELIEAAESTVDSIGDALAEKFPELAWFFENLEDVVWLCIDAFIAFKATKGIVSTIDAISTAMGILTKKTEAQTAAQTGLNSSMSVFAGQLSGGIFAGLTISRLDDKYTGGNFKKIVGNIHGAGNPLDLVGNIVDLFGSIAETSAAYDEEQKKKADGSHRSGLSYVPYDGYLAELHEGERVLTKSEARRYNSSSRGAGISVVININGGDYGSKESLAEAVARELQRVFDGGEAVYA